MRRALRRAHAQGLPVDDPGVKASTLAALDERGLIEQKTSRRSGKTSWRPTDRGLELITKDQCNLLARRSEYGYTSSVAHAMLGEPEAVVG